MILLGNNKGKFEWGEVVKPDIELNIDGTLGGNPTLVGVGQLPLQPSKQLVIQN